MTHKLLLALAALSLVLAFPLAAQVPEENAQVPNDNPEVSATVQDADRDGDLDADIDIDTEADVADDPIADDDNALTETDEAAAIDADEDELPRTASPLPLIALLGAGSLISALGFRAARK